MFHFKKFSIDDSQAAMKIGTDAVMLGSWIDCSSETRILDIGTGTGILALMMAQRNPGVPVDAVELENNAAELARQNVNLSPWQDKITVINTSIQAFAAHNLHKYSLILSNPPFFSSSLKSPGQSRYLARHNDSLPVSDLLRITSELLIREGKAYFIFPADVLDFWKQEALKYDLFPSCIKFIKSTPSHNPHRVLAAFTNVSGFGLQEDELSIYNAERSYSKEYMELTRDFYLHF